MGPELGQTVYIVMDGKPLPVTFRGADAQDPECCVVELPDGRLRAWTWQGLHLTPPEA